MTQATEQPARDERPLLTVTAGGQWLGLPLELVREVGELEQPLMPVPGAPAWLAGLINHHGEVVPVLAANFWFECSAGADSSQLVLLEVGGDRFGMLVERVGAVERLRLDTGAQGPLGWYQNRPLRVIDAEQFKQGLQQRLERLRQHG